MLRPPLPNPEPEWERPALLCSFEREDVTRRIGAAGAPLRLLSGGLANVNIRVGDEHVLRIYRRDPSAAQKEASLLSRAWRSFRSPRLLMHGADFVLLEHLVLEPLDGAADSGAALGRALAEIHATRFAVAGLLGPDLSVREPFPDALAALHGYVLVQRSSFERLGCPELHDRVARLFADAKGELRGAGGGAVLLHGDFKAANLHRTAAGELVVLDWEFAYAGPALMDLGQMVRWDPPPDFLDAFGEAYSGAGGRLPEDWQQWAAAYDLANLVGLLERAAPRSRRADCLLQRMHSVLDRLAWL
jgi:fructosamine-3-kinase